MPFERGKSGNPKGRPPKSRTLARALEMELDQDYVVGGEVLRGHRALARIICRALLTGEVRLNGETLRAESFSEWMHCAKWVYAHVDGPAKGADEDDKLTVRVVRGGRTHGV